MKRLALALVLSGTALAAVPADQALRASISAPDRSPKFVARDPARHPFEVLRFLGVRPDASVVEIYPGGGYWTEILAPYLYDRGTFYAGLGDPAGTQVEQEFSKLPPALTQRMAADPGRFGRVRITHLSATGQPLAPAGTIDAVLTFRNLHNWMSDGDAPQMLAAIHAALKPGGTFGIEDHRARPDRPQDPKAADGYVRQDYAIALIERAGFKLVASSEVEANPRDTTHWPQGVWTLPPSYAGSGPDGKQTSAEHAAHAAIGEADNFLLKFRKVG